MLKLLWKKKKLGRSGCATSPEHCLPLLKRLVWMLWLQQGFFHNAAVTSPQRLMLPLGLTITCRGSSETAADRRRLDKSKRIKKVQLSLSWDGCPLECVKVAGEGRVAVKPSSTSSNISQSLHYTLTSLRSSIKSVWRRASQVLPSAAVILYSKHLSL